MNETMLSPQEIQTVPKAEKAARLILEVRNLKVYFPIFGGIFYRKLGEVKAVDGVFCNSTGEVLGLVGESGCGKSTIGKAMIHLLTATVPDVRIEGRIIFMTTKAMA